MKKPLPFQDGQPRALLVGWGDAMPPPTRSPSLIEIGERAGVSSATVSRALRQDPRIPAATRARVEAAALELGYTPDPLLTSLMRRLRDLHRRAHDVIACVVSAHAPPEFTRNPTVVAYQNGARGRAEQLGYRLEPFALDDPGVTPLRLSRILRNRGLRGVLVAPSPIPHAEIALEWSWFAAATMGNSVATALHRVSSDQARQTQLAVRELNRAGYRRIGLVLRKASDERAAGLWRAGYLGEQWLFPVPRRLPPLITDGVEEARLVSWIKRCKPDAIIGLPGTRLFLERNGWLGAMGHAFASLNVSAPHEMGINQNHRAVGEAAVDLVIEQMITNSRGLPAVPKNVCIEGFWQPGG